MCLLADPLSHVVRHLAQEGKEKMSGSSFDLLMQEIFDQKQRMDELIEENRDLRRQLTDLREGRGIYLEIDGKQFALNGDPLVTSPQIDSPPPDYLANNQTAPGMTLNEMPMDSIPETPLPGADEFEQIPGYFSQGDEEEAPTLTSTFLDEALIDELAATATTQMTAWKGSVTGKLPPIDEEEKAALRKELIGSFLLE